MSAAEVGHRAQGPPPPRGAMAAARPAMRFWPQLGATIVRNLLLKKRDTRKTLAEVTLPLYSLAVLVLLKMLVPNPNFPEVRTPSPGIVPTSYFKNRQMTVAVVPHQWQQPEGTTDFLELINIMVRSFGDHPIHWVMYNTPEELSDAYLNDPQSFPIAVVFETNPLSADQPLRYTIKTNPSSSSSPSTRTLFTSPAKCRESQNDWSNGPFLPLDISRYHTGDACPATQYFFSGFIALQTIIDYTKIMIDTQGQIQPPKSFLRMFPKKAHTGSWLVIFRVIMPMYMVMTLSQFITYFLMLVVGEKENRIREGMRIMGLKDSVYWWSWFIIYGVFVFVLALVSTVLLFTLKVFQHSSYVLIFLLMLLFGFTIITFAFMLTPFFDKARTAGILGSFAMNLMSALYFIQVFVTNADSLAFWFVSLISSSCYALAMDKALIQDMEGNGVTWDNIWSGSGVPYGGALIMMAVDTVIYALIAVYLDAVVPSEYGVKQKPWFCLMPSYWCRKSRYRAPGAGVHYHANGGDATEPTNKDIESVPRELQDKEAIRIVSLHKSFKKQCRRPEIKAINGIDLSIYEGQITAILGHNGAGKSTLFNILTGLTAPTHGTAYIYGLDVRDPGDMEEIRQMTGVCPQHDVLFDLLTVREHLLFFAAIKGIAWKRRSKEVHRAMAEVNLTDQANTFSKNLSGGQKRKLSIAIAIIGDPKIIILDEPTAGVDPISRRQTWRILQRIRTGRVLLLTTHFMDEADILGDRKAVISKGKVRCAGTSLFLKNKFGIGYHLTLVLDGACRENQITRLVRSHVAPAEKARRHGRELSYILPHNTVHHFAPLFEAIEAEIKNKSNRLGITSYGVSMTTLEEVFLSLEGENEEPGEPVDGLSGKLVRARALSRSLSLQSKTLSYQELNDKESRSIEHKPGGGTGTPTTSHTLHSTSHGIEHVKVEHIDAPVSMASLGEHLKNQPNFLQTFRALIWLRAIRMIRDPYKLYIMIFLPILSCAFGLYIKSHQIVIFRMQPLRLDVNAYNNKTPIALSNDSYHDLTDLEESLRLIGANPIGFFDGNFTSLLDMEYFGAFSVRKSKIPYANMWGYFNTTYTHSLPILLNMLDNSIYRSWMQIHGNISTWKPIEVTAHPFQQTEQSEEFNVGNFICALFMGMIFALVPVTLAVDIVYDREIKAKNQLRVNGLAMSMYFLTYFTILIIIMAIISAGVLLLVIFNDIPSLSGRSAILMCSLLIMLYCPAAILFNTCLSYIFDKMDSAQSIMPNITTWIGVVPFVIVAIADTIRASATVAFGLHIFFSFADVMYIPYAIIYYVDKVYMKCHLRAHCDDLSFESYFSPEILVLIAAITVQIPLWFFGLLIFDRMKSGARMKELMPCSHTESEKRFLDEESEADGTSPAEDEDVRRERRRAAELTRMPPPDGPVLVLHNLRKEYRIRSGDSWCCRTPEEAGARRAGVASLSLAVDAGEVFGLLGHNGAGKSTTMKIITGEERPTQGTVMLGGQSLSSSPSAYQMLGYCPQHDALWKNITIREHIECYAAIRGVPPAEVPRITDAYLNGLQIAEHAGKHADNCSGGTKRKLSFALAMVGNPRLVLLDEPSTGMDPRSKRFLWDTILATFQGKKGAVLTTHSMEEADALCSRVAIMVKGGLRCVGSTQHLKNRYGAGYTLEIKLGQNNNKMMADAELSPGGGTLSPSPVHNASPSLDHGDTGSNAPSPTRSADACDADAETDGLDVSIHTPLVGGGPRRAAHQARLSNNGSEERLCGGAEACVSTVTALFPRATLEESFADRLVFSVPQQAVDSLANCFRHIEEVKDSLNIEEYSFSQTTLEQVFLKFAQAENDSPSELDH